jgi:hypothetical protein
METGKEFAMGYWLEGADDEARGNIFSINEALWVEIRDDVQKWCLDNWWRWEEEQPAFFTYVRGGGRGERSEARRDERGKASEARRAETEVNDSRRRDARFVVRIYGALTFYTLSRAPTDTNGSAPSRTT